MSEREKTLLKKYQAQYRREKIQIGLQFMRFTLVTLILFSVLIPLTNGRALPYFAIAYLLAFYVIFGQKAGIFMRILTIAYAGLMIALASNTF